MLGVGTGAGYLLGSMGADEDDKKAEPAVTSAAPTPTENPDDGDGDGDDEREEPTEKPKNTGPFPMTESWVYDTSYYGEDGTVWEGQFDGIAEVPLHEYEDQEGRCFVILGSMSPTRIFEDQVATSSSDIPYIEVLADGQIIEEYGWCDVEAVEAAGYKSIYEAQVTVGTEFKFYHEVFLPASVTGDIEMVMLGRYTDAGEITYTPSFITLP